jgi:hypothetical protein
MCGGECSTGVLNAFITELETSDRSESKLMTNHNTPQLSRMDLANHCAAFPGLSRLNTRAVLDYSPGGSETRRGPAINRNIPVPSGNRILNVQTVAE